MLREKEAGKTFHDLSQLPPHSSNQSVERTAAGLVL